MDSLFKELRRSIQGELKTDIISKKAYSVDASIYEIEPIAIVLPKTQEDILSTIQLAAKYDIPLIPRGAATGITGSCLGKGIIVDSSKYLNRIIEINYEDSYAVCEPGVVQDQLNQALEPYGYRLGPDTSTGNRATLGGMLANNSAGARSLRFGKMVDHVLEVDLALSNGELITLKELSEKQLKLKKLQNNSEGRIYNEICFIKDEYAEEIEKRFPKIPRRVSGYNLDELIKPQPLNASKLIAGSEGSLGFAAKIKMKICPKLKATALCLIQFNNISEAMSAIEPILITHPLALEMIDSYILDAARQSNLHRAKIAWVEDNPACVLIAEYEGENTQEASEKAALLKQLFEKNIMGYGHHIFQNPLEISHIWDVRKAGLELLLSKRAYSRAVAFIEDISLPPDRLSSFMERFTSYLDSKGKQAGIYGHVGSGCMHIRPYINLKESTERELMQQIMLDVSDMLLEFGGALSGEHGDGLIRSWLNKKMFGDKIYEAFVKLKNAFDPLHLMNPGKVVDGPPLLENLRSTVEPLVKVATFQDFSAEGGFELATDLCNGNGLCRKKEGIMCPSFQATDNEYNTTRARAQALRSIVNNKLPLESFTSPELLDVLDLCLECKGCKRECPVQVDMAKMKAEVLYQYQEKHGYFLRNRLFAYIPNLMKMASYFPKLSHGISNTQISQYLLDKFGISTQRALPDIASHTFSSWIKNSLPNNHVDRVVLFNDTYSEFSEPSIGIAAAKVLNAMKYHVIVPKWICCGRPWFSKGLLKQAKRQALAVIDLLSPYLDQNLPIIGLEPSCLSALKHDYKGLLGHEINNEKYDKLVSLCQTFDEFIAANSSRLISALKPSETLPPTLLHVHCHHKALWGSQSSLQAVSAVPNLKISEINSGCCGMAGSFGYEKEHYDLSVQIANLKLVPAIQEHPQSTVIANGISCRSQIAHTTGRKAIHLAEFLAERLD